MPLPKNRDGPTDIQKAYHRHIEATPVGERIADAEIFRLWDDTVGGTIATQFQPCQFHNGTLTLLFENHAWAQEIQWRKTELIEALNAQLDRPRIRELRFRAGKPARKKPFINSDATHERFPPRLRPPEEAIQQIANEELREAFIRISKAILESRNI